MGSGAAGKDEPHWHPGGTAARNQPGGLGEPLHQSQAVQVHGVHGLVRHESRLRVGAGTETVPEDTWPGHAL